MSQPYELHPSVPAFRRVMQEHGQRAAADPHINPGLELHEWSRRVYYAYPEARQGAAHALKCFFFGEDKVARSYPDKKLAHEIAMSLVGKEVEARLIAPELLEPHYGRGPGEDRTIYRPIPLETLKAAELGLVS